MVKRALTAKVGQTDQSLTLGEGNALPYGVRHKVYLNFSGTYQKNCSFATLKLLIEAYEKYFHEPLQKFTIP